MGDAAPPADRRASPLGRRQDSGQGVRHHQVSLAGRGGGARLRVPHPHAPTPARPPRLRGVGRGPRPSGRNAGWWGEPCSAPVRGGSRGRMLGVLSWERCLESGRRNLMQSLKIALSPDRVLCCSTSPLERFLLLWILALEEVT